MTRRLLKSLLPSLLLTVVMSWGHLPGVQAQLTHPSPGFVYGDSSVPRIDIAISQDDLDAIYGNPWSDELRMVSFNFTRDGVVEALDSVGFRPRGNTSRGKAKLSFRLSFNAFDGGRKFYGLEQMNLNAETNDPSMLRSKLSWTVFRMLGVPACRENHVLLYINDNFHGVYNNTEHIDENFMKLRFDTNDGNLYKCTWPADLAYRGSGQENYKHSEVDGRRVYELRINQEWDDYDDLALLVTTLHEYQGAQLMEYLESRFFVQQYLKVMAADVLLSNWDGYIWNKNNFYLYRDPVTGKFSYVPYDLDNTFGIDWLGVDWARQPVYGWTNEPRLLYDKIMEQETYRDRFSVSSRELIGFMQSPALRQEVERWQQQIAPWVELDPYYPMDNGFTMDDFNSSLDSGVEGSWWLPYGIFEYVDLRSETALVELDEVDAGPWISFARLEPEGEDVLLDWTVEHVHPDLRSNMHFQWDGREWQSREALPIAWSDSILVSASFLDSLSVPEGADSLKAYFTVEDQDGRQGRYPLEGYLALGLRPAGPVLINEFMASNDTSFADTYGEFDDWVELFNTSSKPVWLGNLFLSDRKGQPDKYRLPQDYIYPHSFRLVWLDGQPEQGVWHAPFKISSQGELLMLSGPSSQGYPVLDSLSFGVQKSDVSFGREVDGGGPWAYYWQSTPGFSNLLTTLDVPMGARDELQLWPNPAQGSHIHLNRPVSGVILDVQGRIHLEVRQLSSISLEGLSPGIYLLRSNEGETLTFVRMDGP